VTLINFGSAPLYVKSIVMPAEFSETNTCSGSILAGKSCEFAVRFLPSVKGLVTGSMKINDNVANAPQTVSLSGTGS